MSDSHHFRVHAAEVVGVNAAIVLESIYWWCKKNRDNERNYHDGLYWTYNSTRALTETWPYFSEKVIRTAISKLEQGHYIVVGNYNDSKWVHTKWYAITQDGIDLLDGVQFLKGRIDLPKRQNGDSQKGESHSYIPVNKDSLSVKLTSKEDSQVSSSSEYNLQVSSGFVPPTLEEVRDFFATNMLDQSDAEDFWLHYQSQGWVRGNSIPVSDWHALAVSWNKRQKLDRASDRKPKSSYDMSEFSIEHWERG